MNSLPHELTQIILQYCDPIPCRFICQTWRDLLSPIREPEWWNYIDCVAGRGHLELMKWTRDNGAQLGEAGPYLAAKNGL